MSKEEQYDLKKKRLLKPEISSTAFEVKKLKPDVTMKNDIKTIFSEEDEANERDPLADLEMFHSACDYLKSSVKKIKDLKDGDKNNSAEIQSVRTDATVQFIVMKKMNRLAHFRCRGAREATNDAKHQIDHCHLQLQNLLYEAMHLQKEITKCMEFKSKDEEIQLVSVDEFYGNAPESISNPNVTKDSAHQQMLARLEWELEQRKQLAGKLTDTQANKEKMSQEIQSKQDYLETLQPKLSAILESTKPVQDYLEIPYDAVKEQHEKAQHLPGPLYVLYMQISAYKEACDKGLGVSIQGDVEAAKAMADQTFEIDEDSDSDQEEQEKVDSKRRRKTIEARQTEKKNWVLQKHPLTVALDIHGQDQTSLRLIFNYLLSLKIVTAEVSVNLGSEVNTNSISGGELLSPDLILDELYPHHHGNDSPNVANHYELRKHGLQDFSSYIPLVGRPYLWCQWLGGLQFLKKEAPGVNTHGGVAGGVAEDAIGGGEVERIQAMQAKPKHSVSASHMQETVQLLKTRLRSRLMLLELMSCIEKGVIPLSQESHHMYPAKINSRLTSWKRVTFEEMKALRQAERVVQMGLVRPSDFIYLATVDHCSAKMKAFVVINTDCPQVVPFFVVDIVWRSHRTALNDLHIKEMEEEVNIHYKEMLQTGRQDPVLANQMQRLLMCFDVYLETDTTASVMVPVEIPKEKMTPRTTRGRARSRPYKFLPELGIFTQRL